jgi:YVTN family beta-propeller protein
MKPLFSLALCILFAGSSCKKNPEPGLYQQLSAARVLLPNGCSLTPAGQSQPLGDLPLNLVFSPSGKYFAVTNNGQSAQSIMLFDAASQTLLSEIAIPKAWLGLKFHPNDALLYASGGNDNMIRVYQIGTDARLTLADSLVLGKPWPEKISPAGINIDFSGQRLYTVTKEDQSLYVFDLASGQLIKKVALPAEAYTCLLSPDGNSLYISIWGGDQIALFDTQTLELKQAVATESHPNDMVLTPEGQFLFVANANANSISVIDTRERRVVETIMTALYPDAPTGSTSNALALGPEGKTLYVANADNNCQVVFDVTKPGQSSSLGFIPTGWYPTAVKVHENTLFVANGKGMTSLPNPKGPNPYERRTPETEYIGGLFKGSLSFLPVPGKQALDIFTRLVYENTPYNKNIEAQAEGEAGNPIPRIPGEPSPIKYVFYVIKENRTYDQVFGDMP